MLPNWLSNTNASSTSTAMDTLQSIITLSGEIIEVGNLTANDNNIFNAPEDIINSLGSEILECTKARILNDGVKSPYGIFRSMSKFFPNVFVMAWYIPVKGNHQDGTVTNLTLTVELKLLPEDGKLTQDLRQLRFDRIFSAAYDSRVYLQRTKTNY